MSAANKHDLPAFPVPWTGSKGWQGMAPCDGLTMRDYFAAKAMQEVLSWEGFEPKETATLAYEMADAMLLERGK